MSDFNPFDQMTFTNNRCFLCGELLTDDNRSKEHVYPKWLQNKFNLWNASLILLNNTPIRYKDLSIPCCKRCNGIMSNKIEKTVQHLVDGGYDAFIECNKEIVFQWLTKISYGILFKELSLKFDRSNPDSEPIFDPEDMKERKMQYMFLKSIINETTFHNKPYSIFVFRVKNNKAHYWAWENPFIHTFCMQINDIGIVACLMDNNLNEQFFLQYEKQRNLLDQHLHPAQFLEVCAMIVYKASLLYKRPFYLMHYNDDGSPVDIISIDMSGYLFESWNQEEYGRLFGALLRDNHYVLDAGDAYQGNDLVCSILFDEDGNFVDMPL